MCQEARITGFFKPIVQEKTLIYTTNSLLSVNPAGRHIIWRRRHGGSCDILHRKEGSPTYQCTTSDVNCVIEAVLSQKTAVLGSKNSSPLKIQIRSFGPIKASSNMSKWADSRYFFAQIAGHNWQNYYCRMYFLNDQLSILPRCDLGALSEMVLREEDIAACQFENNEYNLETPWLRFPTVYQRVACLKIFNQIVAKGTYTANNSPLAMRIIENPETGSSQQNQTKKFMKRINKIKMDRDRRYTSITYSSGIKPKLYKHSANGHKSTSDLKQYSDGSYSFRPSLEKLTTPKMKTWESQALHGSTKKSPLTAHSESEYLFKKQVNYQQEFECLGFEQGQQHVQVLLLNESFEEMEKKEEGDEEIQKLAYVRKRKMERDPQYDGKVESLKIRLIELKIGKSKLQNDNQRLKEDVSKLQKKLENCQLEVNQRLNQTRSELETLRREYGLLATKGKTIADEHKMPIESF